MTRLKKLRIRETDFKNLSFKEKFDYCITDPERYEKLLTNQEQIQYDRLFKVYHLTHKCITEAHAIKIIRNEISCADDYKIAKKLYQDAISIFSSYIEINKQAKRIAISEKLLSWVEILEEEGKYEEAAKIAKEAYIIGGYDKDDKNEIDWDMLNIPQSIYSDDPTLLTQPFTEAEEIEDEDE